MQKNIIVIGVIIIIIGLAWPVIGKIPLFRLPGDIVINRPGFKFFFPITSMIIISVVITLIMKLLGK